MSEKKLRGLDPRKIFYSVIIVGNSDGSIDPPEGVDGSFSDKDEAIDFAKEQAENEQGEWYIFECRPIKLVSRISVWVEDIPP